MLAGNAWAPGRHGVSAHSRSLILTEEPLRIQERDEGYFNYVYLA
ncbi:MAG: hypothetical protein K0R44_3535 [Thermomicrobiales bacterium]|jgi:hypothetical protein|nr:hypothetical protein [Thermomicrobiales bacterium]